MKYGDTLQQRSIPLWENYNVDYNDIKRLIKVRTTYGQGQAKAIPGSNTQAKQLQEFECELYGELWEQHQRIDLFVQSKAGEIARRLVHLDRQIAQLEIRTFAHGLAKISVRRLEKFATAEAATLKAGEEIQFLSRFVGAQRLAFQKLLKKYRKWTGSADLGKRFREQVLDRPTSFSRRDFQSLLMQWTEVLASVRAPFENGADWYRGSPNARKRVSKSALPVRKISSAPEAKGSPAKASSSAADLHSIWESASDVDIDTTLAVLPLGSGATKAVYWVHPDNIVQIHVLLLQYTRLQRLKGSEGLPEPPQSSISSPWSSVSANGSKPYPRTDEEIGVIICDDLQNFAERRNSETISDSEDRPGTLAEKAVASIRYSYNGEAVIVVGTTAENRLSPTEPSTRQIAIKAKLECKEIHKLFNTSKVDQRAATNYSEDAKRACQWLAQHQEVQPLVQLQARRARFVGLKNITSGGIWATLDKDILMRCTSRASLNNGKVLNTIGEDGKAGWNSFRHAVLEIRAEGDAGRDLVIELDNSHLTERVRGFSLETHAVATLCRPCGMPRPFWLPALEQDIRKLPAATIATKGRASQGRVSPEQSNTRHTSVSATSTTNGPSGSVFSAVHGESSVTSAPDLIEPPPLGAFKKKRRQSHRKPILEKTLREPSQTKQQRYWNEFDDGSEGSENEAYTIFVNPDASYSFPGAATASRLFRSLGAAINKAEEKVASWLQSSPKSKNRENEPLINGDHSPSLEDSDISDAEYSPQQVKRVSRRRYSTFPALSQPPAIRARENLLFRSCLASFGASFVLLIVAAILESTGRRKAEATVDAGVIIGVAASLVFAIIAVGSMVGRKDDVGWVHRSIILLIFACVVVGCGALLASLG